MEALTASPSAPEQLAFLTDAAVLELSDKCRGITHADFYNCVNLTDAAKEAVTAQRPDCNFEF